MLAAVSIETEPAMFKHILIPTDGSPVAAKAIHAGVALAKEMGATVTGYYAQEPLPAHLYGEGYIADRELVAELERSRRSSRPASSSRPGIGPALAHMECGLGMLVDLPSTDAADDRGLRGDFLPGPQIE